MTALSINQNTNGFATFLGFFSVKQNPEKYVFFFLKDSKMDTKQSKMEMKIFSFSDQRIAKFDNMCC